MSDVSIAEQKKAVARELALRRNIYPKWVEMGRIKQEEADHQIACMQSVIDTLNTVDDIMNEARRLRQALKDVAELTRLLNDLSLGP